VRALLDTCILSELRRRKGSVAVRAAVDALDDADLFLSVLSIGELAKGIALVKDNAHKRQLSSWLQKLERDYADRLLPIDLETARLWGELTAAAQKAAKTVPAVDGLIAATAMRHGLYGMTRNTADFASAGVMLVNPWDE
jgi:toxin FitB